MCILVRSSPESSINSIIFSAKQSYNYSTMSAQEQQLLELLSLLAGEIKNHIIGDVANEHPRGVYDELLEKSFNFADAHGGAEYERTAIYLFAVLDGLFDHLRAKALEALSTAEAGGLAGPMGNPPTPMKSDYAAVWEVYGVQAAQLARWLPRDKLSLLVSLAEKDVGHLFHRHTNILNPGERAMVNMRASMLSVRGIFEKADLGFEVDQLCVRAEGIVGAKGGGDIPAVYSKLLFFGEPDADRKGQLDELVARLGLDGLGAEAFVTRCKEQIGGEPNGIAVGLYLLTEVVKKSFGLYQDAYLKMI